MTRKSHRVRPIPKSRNLWRGLVVERPGGMERDDDRLAAESRKAAGAMAKAGRRRELPNA